jgi:hypothetical protein
LRGKALCRFNFFRKVKKISAETGMDKTGQAVYKKV